MYECVCYGARAMELKDNCGKYEISNTQHTQWSYAALFFILSLLLLLCVEGFRGG